MVLCSQSPQAASSHQSPRTKAQIFTHRIILTKRFFLLSLHYLPPSSTFLSRKLPQSKIYNFGAKRFSSYSPLIIHFPPPYIPVQYAVIKASSQSSISETKRFFFSPLSFTSSLHNQWFFQSCPPKDEGLAKAHQTKKHQRQINLAKRFFSPLPFSFIALRTQIIASKMKSMKRGHQI